MRAGAAGSRGAHAGRSLDREMKANYLESDFQRALDIVGSGPAPSALAEGLGVEWDYLAWLGIGVAEEVLGAHAERLENVANGAEAFTAGFLLGAYLPGATGKKKGKMIPYAVDHVRKRGRHAVIADYCDLSAVARFETVYADALVQLLHADEHERAALQVPIAILFESGLATGLVLGDL
jgi:hypothetical protein